MAKKRLRKFSEGGFETLEGENKLIGEDTRSKAMKFVEDASEESRNLGAPVTRAASKSTSSVSKTVAPPAKPSIDMDAERARMEKLAKSQALEAVHPEDYLPGAGLLKPMLRKVMEMGAKRTAKEAAEKAAETTAKNVVRKSEEGFNPSEALDALKANAPVKSAPAKKTTTTLKSKDPEISASINANKARNEANDIAEAKVRLRAAKANNDASQAVRARAKKALEGMADDGGAGAFKRGGAVRSSASRRADGCAIRGKTRA
jgi:hypothetical protein